MRLYLDTNIIMDFLLGRNEPSCELMDDTMRCLHDVLVSDHALRELRRHGLDGEVFLKVLRACGKLSTCSATPEDAVLAEKESGTHRADALHAILAKRHAADIIVTNNIKDFRTIRGIPVRRPDEI